MPKGVGVPGMMPLPGDIHDFGAPLWQTFTPDEQAEFYDHNPKAVAQESQFVAKKPDAAAIKQRHTGQRGFISLPLWGGKSRPVAITPLARMIVGGQEGMLLHQVDCGESCGFTLRGTGHQSVNETALALVTSHPKQSAPRLNLIISDGTGGLLAGDKAAQAFTATAFDFLRHDSDLNRIFTEGRKSVADLRSLPHIGKMPDAVALISQIDPTARTVRFAHIGHMRAMILRTNEDGRIAIAHQTTDHTRVAQLQMAGDIRSTLQARMHPDRARLTRSLMQGTDLHPELSPEIPLQEGDLIISGSSGLWNNINRRDLMTLFGQTVGAVRHHRQQDHAAMPTFMERLKAIILERMSAQAIGSNPANLTIFSHHFITKKRPPWLTGKMRRKQDATRPYISETALWTEIQRSHRENLGLITSPEFGIFYRSGSVRTGKKCYMLMQRDSGRFLAFGATLDGMLPDENQCIVELGFNTARNRIDRFHILSGAESIDSDVLCNLHSLRGKEITGKG